MTGRRRDDPDAFDPTPHRQSNGGLSGLPWWLKGIATVGFPVAVTAFLLAQSAGWIPSEVRTLNQAIAARKSDVAVHYKNTDDIAAALKAGLRIMCENSARTDEQRRHCELIK